MYKPYYYVSLNKEAGTYFPSSIKSRNNKSFKFWERALFQRAISVIEFNFPEEWQGERKDFILWSLFRYGYGVVAKNSKYGTFFQPCTLNGYDFYYQPTEALVSNPHLAILKSKFTIHKDCELIKLTPDYQGIFDIIDYYAEKLSLLDNAINMSLINSKFAFVFGAKNKSGTQAIKKIMDLINKGEPAVVFDSRISDDTQSESEPWQFVDFKVKENYLTDKQLQDFQTILNNFDCEIGIPTIPYQKKERMVSDEANSKQLESIARCTIWVDSLNNSFKKVNKMFGMNLSAKLRFIESMGGVNEYSKNNDSGI